MLTRAWQPTPESLPGESSWAEEPGGLESTGWQESDTAEQLRAAGQVEMLLYLEFKLQWPKAPSVKMPEHKPSLCLFIFHVLIYYKTLQQIQNLCHKREKNISILQLTV